MSNKLKLGILLDSYHIPAWIYSSLEQIVSSKHAKLLLVILNTHHPRTNQPLRRDLTHVVYNLFQTIDHKLFSKRQSALDLKDSQSLLVNLNVIRVSPLQNGDQYFLSRDDINEIKKYQLDILVKIGFGHLSGDIYTCSKYGIWTHDYFCGTEYSHGPWEVMESQNETLSILRILRTEDEEDILYCSSFPTYPYSPSVNRNIACWGSASLLPRKIALLHCVGEKNFFAELKKRKVEFTSFQPQEHRFPSNGLALKLITRHFLKILKELLQRLFYLDTWYLMFDLGSNTLHSLANFRKIVPPKESFLADPMIVKHDDSYYVFVEEYRYKKKRGNISVLEIDEKGNYSEPTSVLEKNYHLSYPFVFEWNGKFYLVPESAENRTIDLYECVEFPVNWKFKMSLMENIKAVDTTLWFDDNRWWLFTGMTENEGAFPQVGLFLFVSDNLFTHEWRPHPLNPIVEDVKNARPAGRIFRKDGKTYRPSQDCSKGYGYGFYLNEIITLSETEYKETKVCAVKPDWDKKVLGVHTYGTADNLTVIDAFTKRMKFG